MPGRIASVARPFEIAHEVGHALAIHITHTKVALKDRQQDNHRSGRKALCRDFVP